MSTKTVDKPAGAVSRVVRHEVRDGVQKLIVGGKLKPGSKLVQQKIAKKFGVAQGVVREALLELQMCGLVETIDNRGMFVGQINTEKLLEAYEIREMHEGLAARLCCTRVTRGDVAKLIELAEQIFAEGKAGRLDQMSLLDRELHHRIAHLAGNSMLIRLAENYVVFGKVVRANRDPKETYQEHLAILQAIGNGQEDEAERLMRQHIRTGRDYVQKLFEKGARPDWVS